MEQLDQARQLEYMFADAGLIKGVQLLNKLAALDPLRLRWHSGDARTLATSLRAVSGDDARRSVKLRCKDVGEEALATCALSSTERRVRARSFHRWQEFRRISMSRTGHWRS